MNDEFKQKFLTNTDETGRFIVESQRTGKKYFVEPVLDGQTPKWGSIDPATGNLMNKKGHDKHTGAVTKKESMITADAGFSKIHELGKGESPFAAIDMIDSKYPDKV